MKVEVEAVALAAALKRVQKVTGGAQTIPILACAKISVVDGDRLEVVSTNLTITVATTIPVASAEGDFATCVNAGALFGYVNRIQGGRISLEIESGGWLRVSNESTRSRFTTLKPDDFPQTPDDVDAMHPVSADVLIQMLRKTAYCVSDDDGRPTLGGAFLVVESDGRASMTATDGHRLSHYSAQLCASDPAPNLLGGVIIPKAGLQVVAQASAGCADVSIGTDTGDTKIAFQCANTRIVVSLIDGTFPDFDAFLSGSNAKQIATLSREDALARIGRAAPFVNKRTHNIRVELDDGAKFTAQDPDVGEVEESLSADFGGSFATAGFCAKYLVDAFKSCAGDSVGLEISDDTSPAYVHDMALDEGHAAVCIVMPMRV